MPERVNRMGREAGGWTSQAGGLLVAKLPAKGQSLTVTSCTQLPAAQGHSSPFCPLRRHRASSPQGQTSCLLAHCCPPVPRKGHRVSLSGNRLSRTGVQKDCAGLWPLTNRNGLDTKINLNVHQAFYMAVCGCHLMTIFYIVKRIIKSKSYIIVP